MNRATCIAAALLAGINTTWCRTPDSSSQYLNDDAVTALNDFAAVYATWQARIQQLTGTIKLPTARLIVPSFDSNASKTSTTPSMQPDMLQLDKSQFHYHSVQGISVWQAIGKAAMGTARFLLFDGNNYTDLP